MSSFFVRRATRADLSAIDLLLSDSYPRLLRPDYPPSVLVTALPLISRAQPDLVASGGYFVAERDGAILGAGGMTARAPGAERTRAGRGNVRHLVTDHRAVRQGIARALMERIVEAAHAQNLSALDCVSTRTAVPFYAAMGFRTLGEVDVALRNGVTFPAIRMERDL